MIKLIPAQYLKAGDFLDLHRDPFADPCGGDPALAAEYIEVTDVETVHDEVKVKLRNDWLDVFYANPDHCVQVMHRMEA